MACGGNYSDATVDVRLQPVTADTRTAGLTLPLFTVSKTQSQYLLLLLCMRSL